MPWFLMPTLCHLVAEERPRAALKAASFPDLTVMLQDYLKFQWTVFDTCGSWADKQVGDKPRHCLDIVKKGCLLIGGPLSITINFSCFEVMISVLGH